MPEPAITPTRVRAWTRCQVCAYVWHPNVKKPRECPGCGTMLWAPESGGWRKTHLPTRLPEGTIWLACARCGHQWFVRNGVLPVRCANKPCGSPYWHRPRTNQRAA